MSITIGPCRIADVDGTHEPGAVIENPSDALVALAEAGTADPETGLPLVSLVAAAAPEPEPQPPADPEPAPEPQPEPAPAPEPAVEPTPEPTPPAEEAAP